MNITARKRAQSSLTHSKASSTPDLTSHPPSLKMRKRWRGMSKKGMSNRVTFQAIKTLP